MSTKLTDHDLLALNALFEQSLELPDNLDTYEPMPDGEYACQVELAEVAPTKESQKLRGSWRFKVLEGEEGAGKMIFKHSILTDNAKNMKRFLNDVAKFGVIAESMSDLLSKLEVLKGEICLVQLKTDNQGRQWISIDVPEE